jgi:hypothetical protein
MRHAWFSVNPPPPKRNTLSAAGEQHSFFCERCGTFKHEVWSRTTGQLLTRRYVHPFEYAPIGKGFNGADLRKELIKRWNENPPELLHHEWNGDG